MIAKGERSNSSDRNGLRSGSIAPSDPDAMKIRIEFNGTV